MMLHLVCDISGSMGEDSKPFILRTVVMTVAQWIRLGYGQAEIRLCAWGCTARNILNWKIKDEFPTEMLVCQGVSSGAALVQLLGDTPQGKVLLVTDGFWLRADAKALKRWKDALPPDTLRVIQIGADANPHLSRELDGVKVFAAEEVLAALDGWLAVGGEWA